MSWSVNWLGSSESSLSCTSMFAPTSFQFDSFLRSSFSMLSSFFFCSSSCICRISNEMVWICFWTSSLLAGGANFVQSTFWLADRGILAENCDHLMQTVPASSDVSVLVSDTDGSLLGVMLDEDMWCDAEVADSPEARRRSPIVFLIALTNGSIFLAVSMKPHRRIAAKIKFSFFNRWHDFFKLTYHRCILWTLRTSGRHQSNRWKHPYQWDPASESCTWSWRNRP